MVANRRKWKSRMAGLRRLTSTVERGRFEAGVALIRGFVNKYGSPVPGVGVDKLPPFCNSESRSGDLANRRKLQMGAPDGIVLAFGWRGRENGTDKRRWMNVLLGTASSLGRACLLLPA